jgi:hypothetical protein
MLDETVENLQGSTDDRKAVKVKLNDASKGNP